jgi:hypothetical protein
METFGAKSTSRNFITRSLRALWSLLWEAKIDAEMDILSQGRDCWHLRVPKLGLRRENSTPERPISKYSAPQEASEF